MLFPEAHRSSSQTASCPSDYSWVPQPLFSPRAVEKPVDVVSQPQGPADIDWPTWPPHHPHTTSKNGSDTVRNPGTGRVDLVADNLNKQPPPQKTLSPGPQIIDGLRHSTSSPQVPSVKLPQTHLEATTQLADALNSVFADAGTSPKRDTTPEFDEGDRKHAATTPVHRVVSHDLGHAALSRRLRSSAKTPQLNALASSSGTSFRQFDVQRYIAPAKPEHVEGDGFPSTIPEPVEDDLLSAHQVVEPDSPNEHHPDPDPYPDSSIISELIPPTTPRTAGDPERDSGDYVHKRRFASARQSPLFSLTKVSRRAIPDEEPPYEADLDDLEIWAGANVAKTSFVKAKEPDSANMEKAARMNIRHLQRAVDACIVKDISVQDGTQMASPRRSFAVPSPSLSERCEQLIDDIFGPSEKSRGFGRRRPPAAQKNSLNSKTNTASTPSEVATPNPEEMNDPLDVPAHPGPGSSSALPTHNNALDDLDDLEYIFSGIGQAQFDQARELSTSHDESLSPSKSQRDSNFFPSSNPLASLSPPLLYTRSRLANRPPSSHPIQPSNPEDPEPSPVPLTPYVPLVSSPSPSNTSSPSHVQGDSVLRQSPDVDSELISPMVHHLQNRRTPPPSAGYSHEVSAQVSMSQFPPSPEEMEPVPQHPSIGVSGGAQDPLQNILPDNDHMDDALPVTDLREDSIPPVESPIALTQKHTEGPPVHEDVGPVEIPPDETVGERDLQEYSTPVDSLVDELAVQEDARTLEESISPAEPTVQVEPQTLPRPPGNPAVEHRSLSVPAIETLPLPDLISCTSSSPPIPSTSNSSDVLGHEYVFEMSETASAPPSSRVPTIFDPDYLKPRYRNVWGIEERAQLQMVIAELEQEAMVWYDEYVEVHEIDDGDEVVRAEDLGEKGLKEVGAEAMEVDAQEVSDGEELILLETQPERASTAGRKRRRPAMDSPRRSKRKFARIESDTISAVIDVDGDGNGDELAAITVKTQEPSGAGQHEDEELIDPPSGLAEKVEEWVGALRVLVKGKKSLRQKGLLDLKTYLQDIYVHRMHFKPASTLAQTVYAVAQLDASDVPYKDSLGLRALAKQSVRAWGIRKLRARWS